MNEIRIGGLNNPLFYFTDSKIIQSQVFTSVDIISNELSVDTATVIVDKKNLVVGFSPLGHIGLMTADSKVFLSKDLNGGELRTVPYGTPVWIHKNGSLKAKMYVENVERISRNEYKLNLISALGLMQDQTFLGDLYSGQTIADVIASIFGGTVGTPALGMTPIDGGIVPCYIENEIAGQFVFGHIPYCSKLEALNQLLFAYNIILTKDGYGDIVFSYLYNFTPQEVQDDDVYIGGQVDYSAPTTRIELLEHSFEALGTETEEILFDNSSTGTASSDSWVYFNNAPIQVSTLDFGTLTPIAYGPNYAHVGGVGVIKGKPYTHVRTLVSRNILSNQVEKVTRIEDATLVSTLNSANVADRLMSYYSSKKTISCAVVLDEESCGRQIKLSDPFDGTTVQGFISSMDVNFSNTDKASLEIVTDYVPQSHGNNFQNAVLLTGSGTWTIPSSVFAKEAPEIKVVLVGGGQGGGGGFKGEDGHESRDRYVYPTAQTGFGGEGGRAGNPGQGGKIFIETINCEGKTSFTYSCGEGGLGGEPSQDGAEGGATTFGTLSSASGTSSPTGVINLFTAEVFGKLGVSGFDGGKGNAAGGNIVINGTTYKVGNSGQSRSNSYGSVQGGGGGGACYGKDGGNGSDGIINTQYPMRMANGQGGDGASCDIPGENAINYGDGGGSGSGGGGGGGNGGFTFSSEQMSVTFWRVGYGGTGSRGGNGKEGCIIVYY